MLVIVPNWLSDAIHAAIDKELAGRPCDAETRQYVFDQLLSHYDQHGAIPDFTLEAKS